MLGGRVGGCRPTTPGGSRPALRARSADIMSSAAAPSLIPGGGAGGDGAVLAEGGRSPASSRGARPAGAARRRPTSPRGRTRPRSPGPTCPRRAPPRSAAGSGAPRPPAPPGPRPARPPPGPRATPMWTPSTGQHEPVAKHGVDRQPVPDPAPEPLVLEQVGGARHRLHPPGHDHLGLAAPDQQGSEVDRLEGGGTHLVDGEGRHRGGQPGAEPRLPGGDLPLAGGEHRPHDELVDLLALPAPGARPSTSRMTAAPRSTAEISLKGSPNPPKGVRAAATMTASTMGNILDVRCSAGAPGGRRRPRSSAASAALTIPTSRSLRTRRRCCSVWLKVTESSMGGQSHRTLGTDVFSERPQGAEAPGGHVPPSPVRWVGSFTVDPPCGGYASCGSGHCCACWRVLP